MADGLRTTIAGLDALRVRLEQRASARFAFGARDLVVHYRASDARYLPHGGLMPGRPTARAVHLHLIRPEEMATLAFPSALRLAPYGALVESVDTDWIVLHSADTGRMLALHRPTLVALHYPGTHTPPRERAEFCRPLLHWLAILDGNVVVHAGGIARDGRGLLVAGAGNAGKSTLARVCLAAGFDILGDNVVEVSTDPSGEPELHAVYPTFKIRRDAAVPVPEGWTTPEWDDEASKDIYFLAGASPHIAPGRAAAHIATLVLDEHGPAEPVALATGRAFFLVAPNTVAQFPFFEEIVLRRSGAAVSRVPALTAGRMPLDRIVDRVTAVLENVTSVGATR